MLRNFKSAKQKHPGTILPSLPRRGLCSASRRVERENPPISLLECARHLPQPHPFQELQDTQPGDRVGLCGSHVAKKKIFFLLRGCVPACRGRGGENRGPTSLPLDPHPRPGALLHRTLCASVCRWGVCFPRSPLCSYPPPVLPSAQIQKVA